jgi:type VI secretion system secreted protein Hcp
LTISAHKKRALSSALALAMLLPLQAAAAADYFLEIEGVKGESQTKGFGDSIEILSWSWGASSSDGKETCAQDLHVAKYADSATDDLVNKLGTGESFSEATLSMVRSGDSSGLVIYHTILLRDVRVTSYNIGGSSGGDRPIEQVSFAYREAEGSYFPMQPDGKLGVAQQYFVEPGKCK